MLTTTMDQTSRGQAPACSSPFQARALHFFKKLSLGGPKGGRKSIDTVSPVTLPTEGFQRARSSIDLLRKPDITRLIGLRVESGPNPMDTDDSSQDASPSGNSSYFRPRRSSTLDSMRTAPLHSTFAGYGAAPLFFHDQAGAGNQVLDECPGNLLAPAPLFLRSNSSLVQPASPSASNPEAPPQIGVSPQSRHVAEAVQDLPDDDAPRPQGDILPHDDTLTNAPTDLVPTTSPEPGTRSRAHSLPVPVGFISETDEERPASLPHQSAPLPPSFRRETERGLRLSPSIITTRLMPPLNLPALPPLPHVPDTPQRQRVRLQSMPSLFRHSHANSQYEPDQENTMLEDSDEEGGDEDDEEEFVDALSAHESDDEDEEQPGAGPSGTQDSESPRKRPAEDEGSPADSPISPVSESATVGPNLADYFCSKTYVQGIRLMPSSTSLAMHPFSPSIPCAEDNPPISEARLRTKPSLYHATSRSMLNLGSNWAGERLPGSSETSNSASTSRRGTGSHEGSEESGIATATGPLLRRSSMPSFHPASDPPPYPVFSPRSKESRIEEGRERLPCYSNSLYLISIMPRKMEFSSPGVQARDRKWRRVVCELEGTTFRVYKCPPGASGAGALGDWWEKHVGVGDVASPNPPRVRKKGQEEPSERPTKLGIDEAPPPTIPPASSSQPMAVSPQRQRTSSQSSAATQPAMVFTPRHVKRVSAASILSPFRSSSSNTTRHEAGSDESSHPQPRELELLPVDVHDGSSLSHESTGRATPVAQQSVPLSQSRSASRLTFLPVVALAARPSLRNGEIPKPARADLLRAYTLQHAESGLGNDYLKRKNVIRVRMEGEQFLLQAPDIPAVVEWIEGLHAGTNIALDIDERPMPRGPMFPRRRRRRPQRPQAEEPAGRRSSGPSRL